MNIFKFLNKTSDSRNNIRKTKQGNKSIQRKVGEYRRRLAEKLNTEIAGDARGAKWRRSFNWN